LIAKYKPKLTKKAGKHFPAFSFYQKMNFTSEMVGLFCVVILLTTACRPKTASDISVSEPPIPQDTIVIVEGDPNEGEDFMEPEIQTEVEEEIPIPELLFTLKKTGCYGTCPAYDVKLFSDGHIIYNGVEDVPRLGKFESRIDPIRINEIFKQADAHRFFELAEFYPLNEKMINELPSTTTFFKKGSIEKTITNNHDSPIVLRSFEKYLENWLETISWTKVQKFN